HARRRGGLHRGARPARTHPAPPAAPSGGPAMSPADTTAPVVPAPGVPAPGADPDRFIAVCALDALPREEGRAALLPGGIPVALFHLADGTVHAVGNLDPHTGAPVMCHGIVGDRGGRRTVASPLGKQVYELATGQCLDDGRIALPVHRTRISAGFIE